MSIDSAAGDISSGGGSYEANRVVLKEKECVPRKMKVIFSAHMRRRAEAILKVLSSHGCASEVRIRQLLGDSPDTSKALRMSVSLSFPVDFGPMNGEIFEGSNTSMNYLGHQIYSFLTKFY